MRIVIKNIDLITVLLEKECSIQCLVSYIRNKFNVENLSELEAHLRKKFMPVFKSKWASSSRNKTRFFAKNDFWLNECSYVWNDTTFNVPQTSKLGRPLKHFDENCSDKTKKRRAKEMNEKYTRGEVCFLFNFLYIVNLNLALYATGNC